LNNLGPVIGVLGIIIWWIRLRIAMLRSNPNRVA
jgi:hypothetical protein